MYKKIEKSSKICLCMIKKTSSHIHIKKNPPKNRPPTYIKKSMPEPKKRKEKINKQKHFEQKILRKSLV